jgi:hypothetical protein
MTDAIHAFSVQCLGCGNVATQRRSDTMLREQLKIGEEITHYCAKCKRSWPADRPTRALLARELGVTDWR